MDDANDVRHGRRISLHRPRFLFLLVILSCLVAGDVSLSLFPSLLTRHPPSLISRDWLYEYIEGRPLAVDPGSKAEEPLVVRREQIESLKVVPTEEMPDEAEISFVLRTDGGQYLVQGYVSSHHSDGASYPVVNLGRGWNVSKQ